MINVLEFGDDYLIIGSDNEIQHNQIYYYGKRYEFDCYECLIDPKKFNNIYSEFVRFTLVDE